MSVCHRHGVGGLGGGLAAAVILVRFLLSHCRGAGGLKVDTLIIEPSRNFPHIIIRWLTTVCGQADKTQGHGHVCLPLIKAPILKQLIVSVTVYSALRAGIVLKHYC